MKYCRDKRYCSLHSLITTGDLFGVDFCYRQIPEELDIFDKETFNSNPMEFYTVSADVKTGKSEYTKHEKAEGDFLKWIQASASMPLVSRIVEIGDRKFLDGGITDSIPLKYFQSIGYDKNIVVLTQPKDYVKKSNKMLPIIKLLLRNYPKIVEAIKVRHKVYNETTEYIKEQENLGNTLIICPETTLPIKRTENDPEKLKETYEIGRKAAADMLDKIKEFLES